MHAARVSSLRLQSGARAGHIKHKLTTCATCMYVYIARSSSDNPFNLVGSCVHACRMVTDIPASTDDTHGK
jgi:hypothetical protein